MTDFEQNQSVRQKLSASSKYIMLAHNQFRNEGLFSLCPLKNPKVCTNKTLQSHQNHVLIYAKHQKRKSCFKDR